MKKIFFIKIVLFFLILNVNTGFSEEKRYDHEIEFGSSKGERILQFNGNGRVNITGYNGNKILLSSNEDVFEEDEEVNEKAKGLRKIGGGGFNIINNEQKNIIIISRPIHEQINLDVKVPNNITLKFGNDVAKHFRGEHISVQVIKPDVKADLKNAGKELEKETEKMKELLEEETQIDEGMQKNFLSQVLSNTIGGVLNGIIEGDIFIKDFSGLVEVSTVQGSITAENIDGEIIASTVQGDIKISFKKLNKDRSLYFSTVNGDIDISLPRDTNADIMSRTLEGDVYTGFNGDIIRGNEVNDETAITESPSLFNNIFQSNYITSRINGGGQKIYLSTINGNIYIRKGD